MGFLQRLLGAPSPEERARFAEAAAAVDREMAANIELASMWDQTHQAVVFENADSDLGIIGIQLLAGALSLAAFTLRRRAQAALELEARAARLEREREAGTRAAVAAERARIARDLHDVITHSVSVMTVQAGAARLLLEENPQHAREPLLSVEETGRQALAEMRRLLGLLRTDEGSAELVREPR